MKVPLVADCLMHQDAYCRIRPVLIAYGAERCAIEVVRRGLRDDATPRVYSKSARHEPSNLKAAKWKSRSGRERGTLCLRKPTDGPESPRYRPQNAFWLSQNGFLGFIPAYRDACSWA